MNTKDNLAIAMTKTLCPICLKEQDGEIVLNTRLTPKHAESVREVHGQVTGFGAICNECKIDGVYLIGYIPEQTTDNSNPYRSGTILGVTRDAFERWFEEPAPEKGAAFIPQEILDHINSQRPENDA